MTTLTLAHDLLLLSLDPETGKRRATQAMGYGEVGALLAELALAGRVDLRAKKVQVVDPSPTGQPRADDLLRRLSGEKERKPETWATKLKGKFTQDLLDDLCTAEIVRREQSRFLGMWDTSRYPQITGTRRDQRLTELRGVMITGLTPNDPRIVALGALIVAVGLHGRVFPGARKGELNRRLKELDQTGWATDAVRNAIAAAAAAGSAAAAVAASS
ncbi:hypothetical protein BJY21_002601 [Kineosphaera limosa]|uniref:GPP34 family phosphoprotein n=1 Tax=Kineosphaera limosa NBRC 100340 TaxID=1184609 RepID=K6VG54_9MICO|nr:GPP34 family phosphoprotein [Kineosphaera limosa]NYE01417.1 hypothetical protein [Kineosphaera limosa]GAB95163.1 hypothetical protein KILIM_017_00080 [Kineosphaera limosa NBRC 100340]